MQKPIDAKKAPCDCDSKEREELLSSLGHKEAWFSSECEIVDLFAGDSDEEMEEVLVAARKSTGVTIAASDKIVDVIQRMNQRKDASLA